MEIKIDNIPTLFYPSRHHKGFNGKYFIDQDQRYFLKKCPYRNIIRESTIISVLNQYGCQWSLKLVKATRNYLITEYLRNSEYLSKDNLPENYRDQIEIMLKDLEHLKIRHNDIHLKQFRIVGGKIYLTDFGWGSYKETDGYKIPNSDRKNAYRVLDELYNKMKVENKVLVRVLPYFESILLGAISEKKQVIKIILPPYLTQIGLLDFKTDNYSRHIAIKTHSFGNDHYLQINSKYHYKGPISIKHNLIYVENSEIELDKSSKNKKLYVLYSNQPFNKKLKFKTRPHDYPSRFKYSYKFYNNHCIILLVKKVNSKMGWDHVIPVLLN